ncbi:MAG: response regulator [Eubacterium sp.]|nr:response regulator [Eubacterium sp.]
MNIIVAFPKIENAKSVRGILQKSGYIVDAVCVSGTQALRAANDLDSGIIICTYRLPDMGYAELYDYLAPRYAMLLIGTEGQLRERAQADIVGLCVPLKVHELLQTVAMMAEVSARKKKTRRRQPKDRSAQERRMIDQAKLLLAERNHFSEEEAHRYLQKHSMANGTSLTETAQMIISLMGSEM